MREQLLQFGIVIAFGALCFGCGCAAAFIVTRNRFRKETIDRGLAHYDERTGKWEWGPAMDRSTSITLRISGKGRLPVFW